MSASESTLNIMIAATIPETPSRQRNMQCQESREQQSIESPNYNRRRAPDPHIAIAPLVLPGMQQAISQHSHINVDDPFYVPPPVAIPDILSMPHHLRPSQLHAALAQLPPLLPVVRRNQNRAGNQTEYQVMNVTELAQDVHQVHQSAHIEDRQVGQQHDIVRQVQNIHNRRR